MIVKQFYLLSIYTYISEETLKEGILEFPRNERRGLFEALIAIKKDACMHSFFFFFSFLNRR